ncbi:MULTISPECIES: sensor histidine kinase [unclassified Microbacterium]|uniref:sensor histidine kinase n=1 Tax=unclassified Microbacterium TaxID=2609290 RepID=UPI00177B9D9C|nr:MULTISPECIES: HAMP domain-containing sensor histidine kinase [unclassified Microbacterium]MBD8205862.1 HAMP domain-containing histidine kinase [Microbacterium sp. CFBP 8801]MBD8476703.1 HAMP domain-containing histidine kinase [Microbacterium sp. CFBP 8794]MBD8509436.1 HAMP domain-containing histidine kinase [Microbacterium sp. CFBP 8790]
MMQALARLSIRARITIGTLLIAALFFTGVAIVVRQQVDTILQNATYDVLTSDATPFETAIQQEPDDPVDNPGEGQLIAVIDPTGATRTSTLPATIVAQLDSIDREQSGPQYLTVDSTNFVVAIEKVTSPIGEWTIISARNENASKQVLTDLTAGLVIGLGALTLLFGIVSWALTGAALRPVTQLRRSADTIVATDSDTPLPVGPANDEIADLAATLNALITKLRASAARERQMVSDASHELRTPLAVLQAQLELLRTGDRTRLDTDLLEAERAAVRLNQLVDSLLELSRLDSGRNPTPATVGELVDEAGEALDRARLSVAGDPVEIELTVPEPAAPNGRVSMAPLLYGRVLDNLLANALDALDGDGRITVTLTVEVDHFVTTVVDTGPGMSPEFLPQAFDRFSQEDHSRTTGHGSGLGLAIVAAAAAAAGGTAQLANAATQGLMISVALPILNTHGTPIRGHIPPQ